MRALAAAAALLAACGRSSLPGPPDGRAGGGDADAGEGAALPVLAPEPGTWTDVQDAVPTWSLSIAKPDLDALDRNVDDLDFEVPAQFTADGKSYDVTVRYRGRSTRYRPKKSFQVKFVTERFDRRKRLELLAQWRDGGMLTEKLWYDLAHRAGLRVPRVRFANLDLNGAFYGVMAEVERVDKVFLSAHRFGRDADIYRCGFKDCEMRDVPATRSRSPGRSALTMRTRSTISTSSYAS